MCVVNSKVGNHRLTIRSSIGRLDKIISSCQRNADCSCVSRSRDNSRPVALEPGERVACGISNTSPINGDLIHRC